MLSLRFSFDLHLFAVLLFVPSFAGSHVFLKKVLAQKSNQQSVATLANPNPSHCRSFILIYLPEG